MNVCVHRDCPAFAIELLLRRFKLNRHLCFIQSCTQFHPSNIHFRLYNLGATQN